jgi:hypothetical protein
LEDIRDQQIKECEQKTCKVAAKIENAFVPVIAYLEWCGIRLDIEKWQMKMKDNEKKRDEALEKLNQWVVDYFKSHGGTIDGYIEREHTISECLGSHCEYYPYPSEAHNVSSVMKETKIDDLLTELESPYYQVCLDYNLNNKFNQLEKIPVEQRDKCEFLVNAICPPGCPHRAEHYNYNSKSMLNHGGFFNIECGIVHNINSAEAKQMSHRISHQDIVNKYLPLGFTHFKLEGRTLPRHDLICMYADYFVKPEYILDFIGVMELDCE